MYTRLISTILFLPILTTTLLLLPLFLHLSKRGIQNRDGVLFGLVLLLGCMATYGLGAFLNIDTDGRGEGFEWCWVDDGSMDKVRGEREGRLKVLRASAGVGVGEMSW
jgi:hypothetical protein